MAKATTKKTEPVVEPDTPEADAPPADGDRLPDVAPSVATAADAETVGELAEGTVVVNGGIKIHAQDLTAPAFNTTGHGPGHGYGHVPAGVGGKGYPEPRRDEAL